MRAINGLYGSVSIYAVAICDPAAAVARQVRCVDYIPWTVNPKEFTVAPMEKRMAQICKVLGGNVKALRLSHGLSQEELAFRADLDRTYISQIERGVSNPSILVLLKISVILGVEMVDLFIKQK